MSKKRKEIRGNGKISWWEWKSENLWILFTGRCEPRIKLSTLLVPNKGLFSLGKHKNNPFPSPINYFLSLCTWKCARFSNLTFSNTNHSVVVVYCCCCCVLAPQMYRFPTKKNALNHQSNFSKLRRARKYSPAFNVLWLPNFLDPRERKWDNWFSDYWWSIYGEAPLLTLLGRSCDSSYIANYCLKHQLKKIPHWSSYSAQKLTQM